MPIIRPLLALATRAIPALAVSLGLGLLTLGCEEDVAATLEPQQPFSLYGILTPESAMQRIRVFPIEGVLQPAEPERFDARLTSTDQTTGETRVWRDTVFQEVDGQYSYAFLSPFQAAFGHTYAIEVERSDQARTRVEVQVPPETEVVIDEPSRSRVLQPIYVRGGAPSLIRVNVTYLVEYVAESDNGLKVVSVTVPYDNSTFEIGDEWVVRVDLAGNYAVIQEEVVAASYQGPTEDPTTYDLTYGIRLKNVKLAFIVGNEEWNPPGGVFDLDVLAQPGVMSNVENGFGFVGAGYRRDTSWLPSPDAMRDAGFGVPDQMNQDHHVR